MLTPCNIFDESTGVGCTTLCLPVGILDTSGESLNTGSINGNTGDQAAHRRSKEPRGQSPSAAATSMSPGRRDGNGIAHQRSNAFGSGTGGGRGGPDRFSGSKGRPKRMETAGARLLQVSDVSRKHEYSNLFRFWFDVPCIQYLLLIKITPALNLLGWHGRMATGGGVPLYAGALDTHNNGVGMNVNCCHPPGGRRTFCCEPSFVALVSQYRPQC